MTLQVSIIVPDRPFWKGEANQLILPTLTGQMGVLSNHIPLLTGLDIGSILIKDQISQEDVFIIVSGGFALINNNVVTILVNEAEIFSNLNYLELEKVFLEKKAELDLTFDPKKKLEINVLLKKAKAKLLISQKLNS